MNEYGQILKTLIRVFLAAAISAVLLVGVGDADWWEVLKAGLTAALTMALVYVDPTDDRYGVKK